MFYLLFYNSLLFLFVCRCLLKPLACFLESYVWNRVCFFKDYYGAMVMKEYNLTPQERRDWCVPSCIQAVFRYEGIEVSQGEIYQKLERSNNGGVFTEGKMIENLFSVFCFKYEGYLHNQVPFHEHDYILDLMSEERNHGIIGINRHEYLLKDFPHYSPVLINPDNGKVEVWDLHELVSCMQETAGSFGLIEKV